MTRIAAIIMLLLSSPAVFPGQADKKQKLDARIEEMMEGLENMKKPDLSSESTEKLVRDFVFSAPRTTLHCGFIKDELAKRPEETKGVIENALARNELSAEYVGGLPDVAAVFGKDYESEIAERCLFHPSAARYDGWFVGSWAMLVHFEGGEKNLARIVGRLVGDGRLKPGSKAWRKWTGNPETRRPDEAGFRKRRRPPMTPRKNSAKETPRRHKDKGACVWVIAILATATTAGICFLFLRKKTT